MSRPPMTTLPSFPSSRCRSRITSRTAAGRAATGTIRSHRGPPTAEVTAGLDAPAAEPRRDAGDRPAVLARADVRARRAQEVGDRLDAVALLHAQLGGAAHDRLAVRVRCEERDERELVDERGNLVCI